MVSARQIFGPPRAQQEEVGPGAAPGGWAFLKAFYSDRLAWVAVIVTGIFTAYAGGAMMFWVHSGWLGEGGPDIPPVAHWALDSTAGFFGLTPALGLILPLAVQVAGRRRRSAARPGLYVLLAGGAFALLTVPGPVMHDKLVARGTWVANHVTQLIGPGGGTAEPPFQPSIGVSMLYQLVVGLPTYIVSVGLAMLIVRFAMAVRIQGPPASLAATPRRGARR